MYMELKCYSKIFWWKGQNADDVQKNPTGWSVNTHLHAYWKHWSTKGLIIDWARHCQPSLSIINVALIDCVDERASGNGWKVIVTPNSMAEASAVSEQDTYSIMVKGM